MDRALKCAAAGLVGALLIVYVAAKVHFFTRFTGDFSAYIAEHWPFWAGMAALGALLWAVGTVAQRRARGAAPEKGSPTKR